VSIHLGGSFGYIFIHKANVAICVNAKNHVDNMVEVIVDGLM
jgi:hypothetical protein